MLEFFNHETLQYPPALANGGEMRSETKSNFVKCILPPVQLMPNRNQLDLF